MKSFFTNLVVAACALHEGRAFSISSSKKQHYSTTSLSSATVGSSNSNSRSSNDNIATMPSNSLTVAEMNEMDTIRGELIEKYIALGHTEEYATREVGYFLEDSERSKQYVEMRRVAMVGGNDLGVEDIVQFVGAFVIGMLGYSALTALHSIPTVNSDGGLPWTL